MIFQSLRHLELELYDDVNGLTSTVFMEH